MDKRTYITKLCVLSLILGVVGVCAHSISTSRACIIGAGSSGLATARYMKDYGVNFTVFEATRYTGGIWRFNPRVGTDEDGLPTFPSSYKNMRSNSFKEAMAFSGFPFPKGLPTFLSADCYYKYLQSFTNHFDLMKHIQFQSLITEVKWIGDKWDITYMKSDTRNNVTEECDFVVVATGEYSAPNVPHFKNQEEFKGKIIHSLDYKDAEHFRDLRVLLVGAGPTAFDFVTQLINVTSKLLHSHHFIQKLPDVPGNYNTKPDIKHFTPSGAIFVDDSLEEFDVAILCTGYTYNLPFLNYKSAGVTATKKYVLPLYNQVVNINHPSMTFVGFGKSAFGSVHDIQAQYTAAIAADKFNLPSQEDMFESWFDHAKNLNFDNVNFIGSLNTDAYLDTLEEIDIPRPPPVFVNIIKNDLLYWFKMFLNFRDYEYKLINDTHYVKSYKPMKEVCLIDV